MNNLLELPQHRRYAVLGTGALGGFYGARLQRAGLEVHFLLHSDYEKVSQTGLVIESPQGNFTLPHVNAYSEIQQMPRCEVIIVSLKTTSNYLLPEWLPLAMSDSSVVLVLQNGLGIETEVANLVGDHRVIGGLCFLCSNKVGPGHICHLDYGNITLGEYATDYRPSGITERMRQIATDFERAGINIQLVDNLGLARWQKLLWNIPFNGLSVVLNATTEEMMANADIQVLVEQLMREVRAGAKGYNCLIADSFMEKMLINTKQMKPYKTSMMLDYEAGRPLEVEAIFGNPLRAANRVGLELPRISMLYQQLKFLDARSAARGPCLPVCHCS